MKHAWKSFWGNYFNFSGRSTRSEYWFFMLDNIIVAFILGILMGIGIAINRGDGGMITILFSIPYYIYLLAIIIPSLALCVRRLHDIGKSGWWYLICMLLNFACGIGGIVFIIFMCLDSKPDNQWGPNPKGMMYNNYYGNQQYYNNPYNNQPQNYEQNLYNQQYNNQYNNQNNNQY